MPSAVEWNGTLEAVRIIKLLRHPHVPNGCRQSVVVGTLSYSLSPHLQVGRLSFCQNGTSAQQLQGAHRCSSSHSS